jgi:3-hydroxyisobutyrate dehydrogenase-like beta-hydroxyacid dehydrogenase
LELSTIDPQTSLKLEAAAKAKAAASSSAPWARLRGMRKRPRNPCHRRDKAVFEELSEFAHHGTPPTTGKVGSCAVNSSQHVGMTHLAVLAEGIRIGEKAGIDRMNWSSFCQDTGARSFRWMCEVRGCQG